jgi:DNA-directed RNA polymerase subunit alpha
LLSSLEGAAVTSIRIADVQHEFSDIPGVREDVIRVMLQIKQLRLKLYDVDAAHMHLQVRGSGVVTAADVITPPEVEIVNPELYLFTVDDSNARLEIDLVRARARIFSRRRAHRPLAHWRAAGRCHLQPGPAGKLGHGLCPGWAEHELRQTGLEIWTDGTISPEDSLSTAQRS